MPGSLVYNIDLEYNLLTKCIFYLYVGVPVTMIYCWFHDIGFCFDFNREIVCFNRVIVCFIDWPLVAWCYSFLVHYIIFIFTSLYYFVLCLTTWMEMSFLPIKLLVSCILFTSTEYSPAQAFFCNRRKSSWNVFVFV